MRRRVYTFTLLLVILAVVMQPSVAFAQDYITDAVKALEDPNVNVYVYPGTEYTDINTSQILQSYLRSDDNIVLVILPAAAEEGTDIESLVVQLSEQLKNERIIGFAVGKKVIGYAPMFPVGVAADQMRRADSVSNDPVTALGTFVQNIHLWVNAHPQPTITPTPVPTPIPVVKEQEAKGLSYWLISILWVLVPVSVFLIFLRKFREEKDYGDINAKLKRQVDQDLKESNESLDAIRELIGKVDKQQAREILEEAYSIVSKEIIGEIEAKPNRATPTTIYQIKEDLAMFTAILELYTQILSGRLRKGDRYIDFQQKLEAEFFPGVRDAFRKIAIELDRGDLKLLENLVRDQSAQFRTRGL